MSKIERIELPAGRIMSIKLCKNGTYEVLLEVEESKVVSEIKKMEEMFVRIEASKLSLQDKFMQYEPQTERESNFKNMLSKMIKHGLKDFYHARIDPSFDDTGKICFKSGMQPAVGKSYNWWKENAKKFAPERKSRLGTKSEYVAFLGVLMKKFIEAGGNREEVWDAVCNNSKNLGHYCNSERAKPYLETTGSRRFCGFFDLANTDKILEDGDDFFWLVGGSYNEDSYFSSLASCGHTGRCDHDFASSVGWIVLEK